MTRRVVDTNVAVIANGRDTNASIECRLRSVIALEHLVQSGCVVIDDAGSILNEYEGRLYPEGQPGVGDRFYRHVLDNRGNVRRVRMVDTALARADALRRAFERGTLAAFDRSDRVFALCAVVGRVPVATAMDSDWAQHEAGLTACGVRIEYVCGREVAGNAARVPVRTRERRQP
jgi:hypothetical protein